MTQGAQEPDIERRLLLAIVLSMAILFVTPFIYQQIYPPPEQPPPVAEPERVPAPEFAQPDPSPDPVSSIEAEESTPAPVETVAVEGIAQEITVENDQMILTLDTRGGVISSILLKDYRNAAGGHVQLIPQEPSGYPRLLSVRLADEILDSIARSAVFRIEEEREGVLRGPVALEMNFSAQGLSLRKRISVPAGGYDIGVRSAVQREGVDLSHRVYLGTGIGSLDRESLADFLYPSVAYHQGGSVTRYYEGDVASGAVQLETGFRWAGIDSKYFAYLALGDGAFRSLRMESHTFQRSEGESFELLGAELGVQGETEFTLFAGPKKAEILTDIDPSLSGAIDYGYVSVLVRPLLYCLKLLNESIQNYGWSIITLTFLISLALFPLRFKQMASMQKMAELQPKLRSIQDKYKRLKRDDPRRQQMNAEVMGLYKEHGVNPLGGCLPLLPQMPILFAFYRMLDVSIELRDAPFMLWIQDLSKPDPYYITPIVMGLTMVAQQKMTPAVGDPAQRRLMMILPIVFTLFFLGFSSGLVLYFLFSNVFAMMFQFGLQKLKPELKPKPPAAAKGKKGKSK